MIERGRRSKEYEEIRWVFLMQSSFVGEDIPSNEEEEKVFF